VDTPLSPENLDTLFSRMRERVRALDPIHLTPEDAADPQKLAKLGVSDVLFKIRETAYGACAICFEAFTAPERRTLDWAKQWKDSYEKAREEIERSRARERKLAPPGPEPLAKEPHSSRSDRSEGSPSPHAALPGRGARSRVPDDAVHFPRWGIAAILGGALLLGVAITHFRRRRG
jgi:hypothetical protein